jgi:hypothetical protein
MKNRNRGYTIFFAMLVSSLALAIGLSIYDLTVRTLRLSSVASQSQYAIYAADTGAECALYWDSKSPTQFNGVSSIFGTSSASAWPATGSSFYCNAQDITASGWTTTKSASVATTTFTMLFAPQAFNSASLTPCAKVAVGKYTDASNILRTTVISHGYNNGSSAYTPSNVLGYPTAYGFKRGTRAIPEAP